MGAGRKLPWKSLKSRPPKTAIPCIFRRLAGETSRVSRSQILSFRKEIYLSGTVSSAPHRTRTLEKFTFLGLHRNRGAHSEVGEAYNKRVSFDKLDFEI